MGRKHGKGGFGVIELLVVIAILAIAVAIVFPIFAKARERSPRRSCLAQVRQIAMAVQIYTQDNYGRFPGVDWVSKIATYLGDSQKMFYCPSDAKAGETEQPISYGYAGLLVRADGSGVAEAQIKSPTEVGVVCDAGPRHAYPHGGLVGGGGLTSSAAMAVTPVARHSGGVIVGYADGHAKYVPKTFNEKDLGNAVTKAFYAASGLGLIDNPAGGMRDFTPGATSKAGFAIGGEYCTSPIITAAAEVWRVKAGATYFTKGFTGQYAAQKRPANYLWGCADGTKPTGNAVALARDAVLIIVAKSSQIPALMAKGYTNNSFVASPAEVSVWHQQGYIANSIQVYTYPQTCATRRYLKKQGIIPGKRAVEVRDDAEMVDKVANDPYGIGVISSVFFDPYHVDALALKMPDGKAYYYPQENLKYRFQLPDKPNWPWMRTLYAVCAGKAQGPASIGHVMLAPGGAGRQALRDGPLFKVSYFLP